MAFREICFVTPLALLYSNLPAFGGILYRPIALEGQEVPAVVGTRYGQVRGTMSEGGTVAITAALTGPAATAENDLAVFNSNNAGLTLIAREGDSWPGLDGPISGMEYTVGRRADSALRVEAGPPSARENGIYVNSGSGFSLLARSGMPAPDTSLTFVAAPQIASMWDARNLTLYANIGSGPSLETLVLYRVKANGQLQLLQRPSAQAPGFPSGTQFTLPTSSVSRDGVTFVKTFVRDSTGLSSNYLYGANDSGVGGIIRTGSSMPVSALVPAVAFEIADLARPLPGSAFATSVRFAASFSPRTPISASLVRGTRSSFSVTAFPQDWQAAGASLPSFAGLTDLESIELFRHLLVHDNGTIFGHAAVANSTSTAMLIGGSLTAPRVLLRLSGPVPGLPGVFFGDNPNVFRYGMDGSGNRVFATNLTGEGVNSGNDLAYFLIDALGNGPLPILREGQTVELTDGSIRTIAELRDTYPLSNNDELILSRNHEMLMNVRFDDNTTGIIKVIVPEPSLFGLVALVACARRRRSAIPYS